MFGIEQLYVAQQCLTQRGLDSGALAIAVQVLDEQQVQQLIRQYDYVMTL